MTSKRIAVLQTIAERHSELVSTAGKTGVPGDGGSVPLPPRTYTPTVREFERLAKEMRKRGSEIVTAAKCSYCGKPCKGHSLSSLRWHIDAHWINAYHRTTWGCPVCGEATAEGTRHEHRLERTSRKVDRGRIVEIRRAGNATLATLGLAWMADNWGLPHEPFLPPELLIHEAA